MRGELPKELKHLSELSKFLVPDHELEGSIPGVFAGLKKLETLSLVKNKFSGSISESIATDLPSLILLDLGDNDMSGLIPSSLAQLSAIQEIRLDGNKFSGDIPSALGSILGLSK